MEKAILKVKWSRKTDLMELVKTIKLDENHKFENVISNERFLFASSLNKIFVWNIQTIASDSPIFSFCFEQMKDSSFNFVRLVDIREISFLFGVFENKIIIFKAKEDSFSPISNLTGDSDFQDLILINEEELVAICKSGEIILINMCNL